MRRLLLFDIDGTILKLKKGRSRQIFASIMKDIFGIDVPGETMPSFSGMTDLQILKEIAEAHGLDYHRIKQNVDYIWKKMLNVYKDYCIPEHVELMPGVMELIQYLSNLDNVQLALLTGNFKDNAYLKLKTYNLDAYFPIGAFGSDNEDRNKLPKLAIERANIYAGRKYFSKSNTMIIGDAPRDIFCAKANDIPVFSVATGSFSIEELKEYQPNYLIKDFTQWKKVIKILTTNGKNAKNHNSN